MSRSQFWLFTINNPQEDVYIDCDYMIYQVEQGAEGTVHLQGYVCFAIRKKFNYVKRLIPHAHWEARKGTHAQAKAYCSKQDTRIDGPNEFGDDSKFISTNQGKRTDLNEVKLLIDQGCTLQVIAEQHFGAFLRYERGFRSYMLMRSIKRADPPEVLVYWGDTGLGKSRRALHVASQRGSYYCKMKSDWWDNYMTENAVIINDFYGWLAYDEMLRLLDRYPHMVQCKGGYLNFNSPLIIITSNKHPSLWYNAEKCPYEPLARRLTLVSCMTNPWDESMA